MRNHTLYPPLELPRLQSWWTHHSQASTPLSIKYLTQCDSTNAQLYRSTQQYNTLLIAEQQSHGKGQFERAWVSQAGDLIFSIGLLLPTAQLQNLSLRVGLSLHQVFSQQHLKTQLKWANDVIATHPDTQQRGKLAGILVQTSAVTPETSWVVIGVGVNIAARWLPQHVAQSAFAPIGLAQLSEAWMTPAAGAREALIMQLVDTILVQIETAASQNNWHQHWNTHDLWLHQPVTLIDPQHTAHHGVGLGINPQGEYQLHIDNRIVAFCSGSLRAYNAS